jgi:hypothetical protein
LVEVYIASRGIRLGAADALRFHADLKHPSGGFWPAMVALVTEGVDATPLAIHRAFLAPDGGGKAPVEPQKMMLGPCRGGAVRLADPHDLLMIGEGIRAKPLETDGMTEADGADANSPPLSASSENGKASNWKGRL